MKKVSLNSGKKFVAGAMVMGAFAAGAFASPVKTSTSDCFYNDADNITNVTEWSTVNFDKLFLTANYSASYLDITGAFKVKDLTIVPYYYGNIFSENFSSTAVSNRYDDVTANSYNSDAYTTNDTLCSYGSASARDKPGVLVGFKDMGFKFSFDYAGSNKFGTFNPSTTTESTTSSTGTNSTTVIYDEDGNKVSSSTTEYKKGKILNNAYTPDFQFGMVIAKEKFTLKPVAGIGVDISSKGITAVSETTTEPASLSNTVVEKNYRNNVFAIKPNFGCAMVLPTEKVKHVFSANYNGQFNVYGASYNDAFGTKQTKGVDNYTGTVTTSKTTDVDGTVTEHTAVAGSLSDKFLLNNGYNFAYKAVAPITENLTLAGRAVISGTVNYNSNKSFATVNSTKTTVTTVTGDVRTTESTTTSASALSKVFAVTVVPTVAGGFEYFVKPGKFAVNGGVTVSLPNYSYSSTKTSAPDLAKTTTKVTENNNVTTDSTAVTYTGTSTANKAVTSRWNSMSAGIYTGFSWFLADNFIIDTSLRLNGTYGVFSGNIGAGCTLKF